MAPGSAPGDHRTVLKANQKHCGYLLKWSLLGIQRINLVTLGRLLGPPCQTPNTAGGSRVCLHPCGPPVDRGGATDTSRRRFSKGGGPGLVLLQLSLSFPEGSVRPALPFAPR